jgi:short-subunit dehydrogenase
VSKQRRRDDLETSGLAVVTGASAGIGAEFAAQLKRRGYDLLLIARRSDRLQQVAGALGGAQILVADLALESDLERVAAELERMGPALLVNNAGFGTKGLFSDTPLARQMEMHRLHVLATVRLTRAVLPAMVRRKRGAIINVSSVASYARSAGSVSYCATKSWMSVFSEGLYLEMKRQAPEVRIQALCPGYTYSEFHDVMETDRGRIPKWMWLRADRVVRESLDALASNRLYVIPGAAYACFAAVFPKLPVWMRLWLSSRSPQAKWRV